MKSVSTKREITGQESNQGIVVCLPDAFTDCQVYIVGDSIWKDQGLLYDF